MFLEENLSCSSVPVSFFAMFPKTPGSPSYVEWLEIVIHKLWSPPCVVLGGCISKTETEAVVINCNLYDKMRFPWNEIQYMSQTECLLHEWGKNY